MQESAFPKLENILSAKLDNEKSTIILMDKDGNEIQCSVVIEDGIKKIKYSDTIVATYTDTNNIVITPIGDGLSITLTGTANGNNFVNLGNLQIKTVSISEGGDSDIMTITDTNGNKYNFSVTDADNNGILEIRDNKGNIIGSFNPETGKLELTHNGTTITTNLASTDIDGLSFVNLENLQVQDASLNLTEEPNTMTVTDVDGTVYTFNITDTNNDGIYELRDANGQEIGSFNPATNQMIFKNPNNDIVVNLTETNEDNHFVNLETLDVKNVTLDLEGESKSATLTAVNGKKYTFNITDTDNDGIYEIIDANGNEIATFDPENGILNSNYISGTPNFLYSKDGYYTNIDDIDIVSYNVDFEKGKMTISDGNTEYEVGIEENSDGTYNIKLGDSVIGNYDPKENNISLNNDNNDIFAFVEDQNGRNVNLDNFKFISGSVNIQGEEKSITLTGTDGKECEFTMIQESPGSYIIQDADGNTVGNYDAYTGELTLGNNTSQTVANSHMMNADYKIVNVEFTDFDSFSYTFDEDTKTGVITFKVGDEEYVAYLRPGEDGKYEIQTGGNTFATFDRENGVVEFLESGKTESFILSSNNEFVNINNIDNINSINYNIDPITKSGTITLYDGDVSYELELVLGEDGLYDIKFGDNIVGSFNVATNQLTLDNDNQVSFNFVEDINGKITSLKDVDIKSGSLNTEEGTNHTITLVDANGVEYTFNIEDKTETGTYNIRDASGNTIGTFNPSTGLLDLTPVGGEKDSFVVSKEGNFLDIEELDVQGGSFNLKEKTVTFFDEEGKSYTFSLGDVDKFGSANILFNDQIIGSFNTKTGDIVLGNKDPIKDFIVSYDNKFVDLSELNPKTLEFEYMKMDKDGTQIISITDEDGTEYQFSATKSFANPDIYIIKDAEGEVIATFNPKTGELFMGENTEEPFVTFVKTNDGVFVDPAKIEAESFECDYEKGTVSIVDKDGNSFEFKIQDNNGDGIFVITDANNNKIGTLTPGDVESELDLTLSGGKKFDILTLSDEYKDLFSKVFENKDLFSDFIRKNDYNGLKEALNEELEKIVGQDNPELLEKAKNVVNDMELDGVKTKEDFVESLNKSLEDNGFNPVEDIKTNIPWKDLLTSNAAIATYIGIGGIILTALLRQLIKYLLEKAAEEEREEKEANNSFDPTRRSSNQKSEGLGQLGTNISGTSTPNNIPSVKSKNTEREQQ